MREYLELMRKIKKEGVQKEDRTGTGTLSIFGNQMRFNLSEGFPAITTKKLHFRSIIHELLWFLKGDTNIAYLNNNGVHIWDEWADSKGDLGPIYGSQWRSWKGPIGKTHDQVQAAVKEIKENSNSRRILISAWNVGELDQMALFPCHVLMQFYVAENRLSCQVYQRSADVFLGVPFNIASYAMLTMMMAQVTGFEPGELIHTLGDAHLYLNHLEQVDCQLNRSPYPWGLTKLELNPEITSIDSFKYEDLKVSNYKCHPQIKAPIAI